MHPGWAAQSGLRAALLARAGFIGPRTVFEGMHGLFNGFAHTREGNYAALLERLRRALGDRDAGLQALSVRDHDPALHRLRAAAARARHRSRTRSRRLVCEVGEGTVHRLWEPLADKQRPPNGYAAKFATPYCIAAGLVRGGVGLDAFTDDAVRDPAVRALAAKVRYEIDPANPYPRRLHRPHPRALARRHASSRSASRTCAAAAHEPLSRARHRGEIRAQRRHGGWSTERIDRALALARKLFDGPVDLGAASRVMAQ